MYTIIALFALAAVIGLTMLMKVLKGENPPRTSAIIHGVLAAVALVLLILEYVGGGTELATALIVLVVAALGGFFLFFKDLSGKEVPKNITLVHASAAVIGFILLLLAVL